MEEARLAASGQFYLELALSAAQVRLCHSGAAVATYPISGLAVGGPRLFFFSRAPHGPWVGQVWTDAQLDPPRVINRVKIVPGDASTIPTPDTPGVIPPTMDELIAVPAAYKIRFAQGQTILVNLSGTVPGKVILSSPWKVRWAEFLEGLGTRSSDPLRIRVTMPADDGAALFRSFPEKPPQLLVLP